MAEQELLERFGRDFRKGDVLFRDGDPGKDMFVVKEGRVTVSKSAGGVEKILSTLGPGEFFGEMAILNNRPRSATAACSEDSRLLIIDAKTFEAMIRGNAEIAVRMIKKLADRLREADEQIENLLFADVSSRVVHYLALAAAKTTKGPAGHKVELPPKELSGRIGVRPAQVDEVLSKLTKANIVRVDPDGFFVPNIEKLQKFLEFLRMKAQFGDLT